MTLMERREARGLTQREAAQGLRVTERTYQRWESHEVMPDGDNLLRLADFFGCHPRELFEQPTVRR